ncbi:SEC-C metal-binding domain-containing protein [Rhodococcus kronopolitis]|uniref:SEC-C metal-binding domain-containing protein n=1 Tax=Rhodococcus kronopolitis TaxID=1460226 RepID=A0ABV9FWC8_9NOCA
MTDLIESRDDQHPDTDELLGLDVDFDVVDVAECAMDVLRERGPLSAEDWASVLVEAEFGTIEEMTELAAVLEGPALGQLADGRKVAVDSLLEGRVLTHRLTAAEIASGIVDIDPDLSALTCLVEQGTPDGGRDVTVVFPEFDAAVFAARGRTDIDAPELERLLLDPDALAEHVAGDMIGLGMAGGALRLVRVDRAVAAPDLAERLGRIIADGTAEHADPVVWQLIADDPELFTAPAAPLAELFDGAGYVSERNYVAARGFDFAAYHRANLVESIARENKLRLDEAGAVVDFNDLVCDIAEAVERGEDPDAVAAARVVAALDAYALLEDPSVAAIALDLTATTGEDRAHALHAAAVALIEHAPRQAKVSAHWLAGKAADRLGDVRAAMTHYESALDRDPEWTLATFDLALLAADAGDLTRAQSLLGRIEGGDAETLHEVLERYQPVEHPGLGRNDRCWCGSGRKYKACHLGKSELTVDARASWLYTKALMFARTPELFDLVYNLAEIRAGHSEDEDATIEALEGGLVIDAALFEGGVLEQFVERREQLLPAEELELARQWLTGSRGLYEVTAAAPGESLTLREVTGGDVVEVTDSVAGHNFVVGTLVCARLLPTGESVRAFGGIEPVDPEYRDELLELCGSEETEPDELVDVLSLAFARG